MDITLEQLFIGTLVVAVTLFIVFPILIFLLALIVAGLRVVVLYAVWRWTTIRRPFQIGDQVQSFLGRQGEVVHLFEDGSITVRFPHAYGSSSIPFTAADATRLRIHKES